jgi:hypoxanthine phosphoribosyltransferase
MPCELVSWSQFYALARRLALQVQAAQFDPDIIVAIGRGGYLPARIVADYLGVMDLASLKIEHYRAASKEPIAQVRYPWSAPVAERRVLLVDDVSDTGDTFRVAIEHVSQCGAPSQLRTAALHHKSVSTHVPDFYAAEIVRWRWLVYPWAIVEDLGGLLSKMTPRPRSLADAAARLKQEFGIEPPEQVLRDVLELGEQRDWSS